MDVERQKLPIETVQRIDGPGSAMARDQCAEHFGNGEPG
jgi:hypothetical protein